MEQQAKRESNVKVEGEESIVTDNDTTISETKIPIKRKLDSDSVLSTSKEAHKDAVESPPKDWAMWKPGSLKSKKHAALYQPKEKRPYDKLAKSKFEMVVLRRRIMEEEIEEKMLMKQAIEDEMRQTFEWHQMQKKLKKLEEIKLLLEIEIMRRDLEE